jgi:hypothetical protein
MSLALDFLGFTGAEGCEDLAALIEKASVAIPARFPPHGVITDS